ncbi:hypothetical protein ACPVTF_08080 [Geobacillus icigianus]|uniref:Uncharacterized protein n=1 Tax=Geobacillus subterraneus TaxID=129338 RepID=A0A679FJA6_9BACL|nr:MULTISPECIES: hypothetical protein [Geobacillus]KYD24111.1 hypothetical protein B4113_2604 [Geobacillus sp. B4113_201601]BBW96452.1 hypothetical protein GsuE55_12850 [Geobacillus subterraneus]
MDVYVLEEGRFRHQGMYVRDETIPVRPFLGFTIDLKNVFAEEEQEKTAAVQTTG